MPALPTRWWTSGSSPCRSATVTRYLVNGSLDPLRRPRVRVGSREVSGVRLGEHDLPFERRAGDLVVETVVPALGAALLRIR